MGHAVRETFPALAVHHEDGLARSCVSVACSYIAQAAVIGCPRKRLGRYNVLGALGPMEVD